MEAAMPCSRIDHFERRRLRALALLDQCNANTAHRGRLNIIMFSILAVAVACLIASPFCGAWQMPLLNASVFVNAPALLLHWKCSRMRKRWLVLFGEANSIIRELQEEPRS
jgi:Flp pilus assembly protein TadB